MSKYGNSRIFPTILTVVIIIVAIVGIVALARVIFSSLSSNNNASSQASSAATAALLDSSAGVSTTMSVRGPIVADEEFRSYRITITPSERRIETFKGYLENTIEKQTFPNNVAAYEQFVHALNKANFTSARNLSEAKNELRGVCATGRLYEFSTLKNNQTNQHLWTSTCSGSQGSLRANSTQLTQLFVNQIPGAAATVRQLSI